jgi:hypothetical protein
MLTKKDKIKELAIYLVQNTTVSCLACENKAYEPVGVSKVMTFKYEMVDTEIMYDKWYVENFEVAKKMGLPGTEHHDQLVKGSGVKVFSKPQGAFTFYGHDANEIINACEFGRDPESYMIQTIRQKQK